MLSVKTYNKAIHHHTITFKCPNCNSVDVAYNFHPRKCYRCGVQHVFDVDSLLHLQRERIRYYKSTSMETSEHNGANNVTNPDGKNGSQKET